MIYNGTTVAGLASLSATAPTLPTGYTYFVRVGANITDASGNFMRTKQRGNRTQYVVTASTNTPNFPIITNTANSWPTSVSVSGQVPPTASQIFGIMSTVGSGAVLVGPNGNTAVNSVTNPTLENGPATMAAANYFNVQFSLLLESANIFYEIFAGGSVACMGWVDKVNAS